MNFEDYSTRDIDPFGFVSEVRSAFNYLLTDYGFSCVRIEPTFLRYESPLVFINIYHGRKSSELGVEIGQLHNLLGERENFYTIGEVMDLMGVREKLRFTFFQASTRERVRNLIPKLAEYVREYARPILEGDTNIFQSLQELRSKKSEEFMRNMFLSHIREESEKAWRKKDYAKLVELYNSMKGDLTTLELKRLEYVHKRLHSA
jgi:hypothetical protein